jgi:hypothetical protein
VAVLDEARADLRGDKALAVENSDRVPAVADEQRGDDVVVGDRLEQGARRTVSYRASCASPNGGRTTSASPGSSTRTTPLA